MLVSLLSISILGDGQLILPEDVALWPWGMDQLIERFTTMPDLKSDPKLAELRRRLARA